jgi:tetratricopeptide (TPR) repeat protein
MEISLLGWKKVERVTDDGAVVKKTLVDTTEWQRPNDGAKCVVTYEARLADGTVFDRRGEDNPLHFTVDEEEVPEGLELAVCKMKKGEVALVTVAPKHAFAATGAPAGGDRGLLAAVPPEATVTYEVTLQSFEKSKETWEMDVSEKVEAALALKERGNAAFKAGRFDRAVKMWGRAMQAIEYDNSFDKESRRDTRGVKRSCNLNLAAAHLKAGRPVDARKAADKVLEDDGFNLKALYRRAQAYMATSDFLEAEMDLRKGLGQEPDNTDFKALLRRLRTSQAAASKKEAELWSSTFQKMAMAGAKKAPVVEPVGAPAAPMAEA